MDLKLNFQELFLRKPEEVEAFLRRCSFWARHSRREPMKGAAATIRQHWERILRWFSFKLSKGQLEGMNSL